MLTWLKPHFWCALESFSNNVIQFINWWQIKRDFITKFLQFFLSFLSSHDVKSSCQSYRSFMWIIIHSNIYIRIEATHSIRLAHTCMATHTSNRWVDERMFGRKFVLELAFSLFFMLISSLLLLLFLLLLLLLMLHNTPTEVFNAHQ